MSKKQKLMGFFPNFYPKISINHCKINFENTNKSRYQKNNTLVKAGACFIGSKNSKKKFSRKSTVNIFKNMPTKF